MSEMENMKAVRIHNYGGPEVLTFEDAPRPGPGSAEVLIRVHAGGSQAWYFAIQPGVENQIAEYQQASLQGFLPEGRSPQRSNIAFHDFANSRRDCDSVMRAPDRFEGLPIGA
jgi:hypothetical protein